MLSNELSQELGTLIRSLEAQVRQHPSLLASDEQDVIEHIDQAIVALVVVRMKLRTALQQK